MLRIKIEGQEFYDSENEMFFETKPTVVRLEHSLISISKWESIWEKPFLPTPGVVPGMQGAIEELSYVGCMIIGDVDVYIPGVLLQKNGQQIRAYIEKKNSATTIHRRGAVRQSRKIITSEVIYYWMIRYQIPMECEKWHFNRLLMLIDVCSINESSGTKAGKMTHAEANRYMRDLNRQRRGL